MAEIGLHSGSSDEEDSDYVPDEEEIRKAEKEMLKNPIALHSDSNKTESSASSVADDKAKAEELWKNFLSDEVNSSSENVNCSKASLNCDETSIGQDLTKNNDFDSIACLESDTSKLKDGNSKLNESKANKVENLFQTSSTEENLSQTSSKEENLSQTSSKEENLSQTASKEENLSQTASKEENLSQTSSKNANLSQTASKEENPSQTSSNLPKKRGLDSFLSKVQNKKPKMNTLQMSLMDWESFKEDEGISEDLQTFNKGKRGFLERQAFLSRSDLRSFEVEKSLRLSKKK